MNRVTESGTPANLRQMAAYKRFTDTNTRIASSASLLPINSCPLDHLEPANASRRAGVAAPYCFDHVAGFNLLNPSLVMNHLVQYEGSVNCRLGCQGGRRACE